MSYLATTDDLFFNRTDLDQKRLEGIINGALKGADDGELYLEYRQSEGMVFDDGRLKNASFDTTQGFGLRAISGESAGYAHASDLSEAAIIRAVNTVQAVHAGHEGTMALSPLGTNRALYTDDNPLSSTAFETKIKLLSDIDSYARSKDPRVIQVSASLSGEWQAVQILRSEGHRVADIRPLVRLNISVTVADGDKMESGSYGGGGRFVYDSLLDPSYWQNGTDEAIRRALVNLNAIPAPAGEMQVILGPGWPGILLHEAVGHGLEGDFNRKKTSTFSDRIGERVASPGVTVVDDGTLVDRRGSISVDDEGTPSQCTPLIEDGILVGYMQDRQNARLMGQNPTGNGRRQSYAHLPMPRMTNTVMYNGAHDPAEMLKAVKNGIYAVNFGGGQVDITSGKFVFSCTEAYQVRDGIIGQAVKGATLIGNGPDVMQKISMIGNDMEMDEGVGTCGKNGQGVPVGVGQPSLLINGITVGGTA
ncbi:metalloprotease TldD [Kiloniella laminariae]|uniref:Metalloprotease TldD n=1 Tax=Kiloniella laminariae TaxID=454162 RepID=A0ABT4LLF4_9PROT|nr:metalloprotease TldD [Kiloniella laminariae]MCZ4281775.1 metalloprotease TldD [Kiloniella laminariae]